MLFPWLFDFQFYFLAPGVIWPSPGQLRSRSTSIQAFAFTVYRRHYYALNQSNTHIWRSGSRGSLPALTRLHRAISNSWPPRGFAGKSPFRAILPLRRRFSIAGLYGHWPAAAFRLHHFSITVCHFCFPAFRHNSLPGPSFPFQPFFLYFISTIIATNFDNFCGC